MTALKKIHIAIVFIIAALMFATLPVCAQQSQPFTQYLFSRFLLNPAACGADGYTSVSLIAKDHWTGFPGAPMNQTINAQIRLPREGIFGKRSSYSGSHGFSPENIGVGVALFNDMRGPIRTTGGHFTYAYHIESPKGQLSFGLNTSLFQLYIDRNQLQTELGHDRLIDGMKLSSFVPEAAFGLHYTTRSFYSGLSAFNLFQSYLTFGGRNTDDYRLERQYIFLGGYIFDINREWTFVPGAQVKFNESSAVQVDFNAMFYYFDQFWGGVSYRSGGGGAIGGTSLIFGMRYEQYHFGYAYDHSLSNIQRYSFGSHEVMVSVTFGREERFFHYKRRYEFQDTEQQFRRTWVGRRLGRQTR